MTVRKAGRSDVFSLCFSSGVTANARGLSSTSAEDLATRGEDVAVDVALSARTWGCFLGYSLMFAKRTWRSHLATSRTHKVPLRGLWGLSQHFLLDGRGAPALPTCVLFVLKKMWLLSIFVTLPFLPGSLSPGSDATGLRRVITGTLEWGEAGLPRSP